MREDIYKYLLKTKGKNIAIEYVGESPQDLMVMFPARLGIHWSVWAVSCDESGCRRPGRSEYSKEAC